MRNFTISLSNKPFSLVIFLLILVLVNPAISMAAGIPLSENDRPFIDVSAVPAEAMEKGKLRIQFSGSMSDYLDQTAFVKSPDGILHTGIPSFDALNTRYGVHTAESKLQPLYAAGSRVNSFRDRHREWGFHLWYDLHFDATADMAAMVADYMALKEVSFAEPVYRIVLHDPVDITPLLAEEALWGAGFEKSGWVPNDPFYPNSQWHFNNTGQVIGQPGIPGADISMQAAWEIEKGSPEVIVAIIDSGIQYDHPDLAGNMWDGIGFNFVFNNYNVMPANHGTHVGGTVAALTNNGIGLAGVAGGSGSGDGVRLMSCQIFVGESSGGTHNAMIYAADNGAAISQNSWGYQTPNVYSQLVLNAIDYFNANGGGDVLQGGITITSAGNLNSNGNYYPGFYSGSMAVSSTDNRDIKSTFSNYGAWVEIAAPGTNVASTVTGNTYSYMSGTSMSCPHVSGVAALLISHAPGFLTAPQLRELLKETTDNIDVQNPAYAGLLGTGRLNAYQALLQLQDIMGAVQNPVSFQATAISVSQIDLSWEKNQDEHPVMIAWSADGEFGTPAEGSAYETGSEISGGGLVLYRGAGDAFSHTELDTATTYFYRAWSYDEEFVYSNGRNARATTVNPFSSPNSLTARVIDNHSIALNWLAPGEQWLYWGPGDARGGVGTGNPVTFEVAQRFSADELDELNAAGKYLTHIRFSPRHAAAEYSIKVWTGGSATSPGTLVLEQAVEDFTVNIMNSVMLDEPVFVNPGEGLWFGYKIITTGGYPAGTDNGPAVNGSGNMILWNNNWTTLLALNANLNTNWALQAFITPELDYIPPLRLDKNDEPIVRGGYNIYRNGEFLASTETPFHRNYFDENLDPGTYAYEVTAWYQPFGESSPSETALAVIYEPVSEFPWLEGFEEGFPPPGWTQYSLGQAGTNAFWQASETAHEGISAAMHLRTAADVLATSWLVSRQLTIPEDSQMRLSFFEQHDVMGNYGYGGVWISNESVNPLSGDFVEVYESWLAHDEYYPTMIDLSPWAGESIFIAFLYEGQAAHNWWIDEVEVSEGIPLYGLMVKASPEEGGSVSGEGQFEAGTPVSVEAVPAMGYSFLHWLNETGETVSTSAVFNFDMPAHKRRLTAVFQPILHDLVLQVNPAGSGTVSGEGQFAYNTQVTVSAEAAAGFRFVNWRNLNGNIMNTQPQWTFSMPNANTTYIAHFEVDDTSVAEAGTQESWRVFPNPARDQLTVISDVPLVQIRIIDMLGQLVYETAASGNSHTMQLSGMRAGIYFIQLINEKGEMLTRRVQLI